MIKRKILAWLDRFIEKSWQNYADKLHNKGE